MGCTARHVCGFPSFLLTEPVTRNKSIVVQDEANNLYLIDDAGNISWKKKLTERVMGTYHVVDAYRNGQQQIFSIPLPSFSWLISAGMITAITRSTCLLRLRMAARFSILTRQKITKFSSPAATVLFTRTTSAGSQ